MKLAVNKEHKSGNFDKKKSKGYLKLVSLGLVVSTFTGLISTAVTNFKNLEEITSLNSNVRASVYYNNDYLINKYNIDEEKIFDVVNNEENNDTYITKQALEQIYDLHIDRQKNDDLSFLKKFPNLKELSITNGELLTVNDINYINESNLDNLIIQLGVNDIIKFNADGISFDSLNAKSIKLNIYGKIDDELSELIIYCFIKNNPKITCDKIDMITCSELYERVEELYNKIDFTNCTNESDKVFKIINFLINYIDYDQSLEEYQRTHKSFKKDSEEYNEAYYYNEKLLSSVLFQENDITEGICCNYGALFSLFCYKTGIENYYVTGEYNNQEILHAWNVLCVDKEYKLVDLVKQDLSNGYCFEEELDINDVDFEELKNQIIENLNEDVLKVYNAKINVEKIFEREEEIEPKIYNIDTDGDLINNQKLDFRIPAVISLGSGLIVVLLGNLRKRSEGLKR